MIGRNTAQTTILVLVESDSTSQAELAALYLADSADVDVVVAVNELGGAQLNDFEHVICKADLEYVAVVRLADVVIVLDRSAEFTRHNRAQLVLGVTDADAYVSHGLPIVDAGDPGRRGTVLEADRFESAPEVWILGSERNGRRQVGSAVVHTVGLHSLCEIHSQIESRVSQVVREADGAERTVWILITGIYDLELIPRTVVEFLSKERRIGEIRINVVSSAGAEAIRQSKLPIDLSIPTAEFVRGFGPGHIGDTDYVIFAEGVGAALFAVFSWRPIHALLGNLRLLDARGSVDWTELSSLAEDPTSFHVDTLDRDYVDRDVVTRSVDLIVPYYDTATSKFERCLRSALDCRDHHEATGIIVVDDGSTVQATDLIRKLFPDEADSIRVVRHVNEGLGYARNRGVRESEAEFIFFLDSDDEVIGLNLRRLLTHAILHDADLVVGKRHLVDAEGRFISDSLDYTFRGVARRATSHDIDVFDDHMANNKLIRRQAFVDSALWFETGAYEDNSFTARLYNELTPFEMLNLPIHRWFQYGVGDSITKTASFSNLRDKIASLESSWAYLGRDARRSRIKYNLNNDLPFVLRSGQTLPLGQRKAIQSAIHDYVEARLRFISTSDLTTAGRAAMRQLRLTDHTRSRRLLPARQRSIDSKARHYFFPRTHFHVIEAAVATLEFGWKAVVVIDPGYVGFDDRFILRLRASGVFDGVVQFTNKAVPRCAETLTRLGPSSVHVVLDVLSRLFDGVLEPTSQDVGVLFSEGLPESYAIHSRFKTVYKFEDAYDSTTREFELNFSEGIWGVSVADVGVWGPINIMAQSADDKIAGHPANVDRVFVPRQPRDGLLRGGYADSEVVLFDVKAIANSRQRDVAKVLKQLYGSQVELDRDSTIVLTQPLFYSYCSQREHFAVVAYLMEHAPTQHIYIKPHPMDPNDYSSLGARVLEAGTPFEAWELSGHIIDHVTSFGSSAAAGGSNVLDSQLLFPLSDFNRSDVVERIREICYDLGAIELPEVDVLVEANRNPALRRQPDKTSGLMNSLETARLLLAVDPAEFTRAVRRRVRQLRSP